MTYSKNEITKRKFDVVIVGAGGSGMRASLQLARAGLNVAVLSKVFPTRSHTVAAQGGIGASLGNMSEDSWHYHFYDTIKGSDWLGDQDAIEFMCREAPKVVYDLEHMGMPFDRNPDGTIYQRPFGGHTANYGEKPVQRACAAADRTGHAMLHTLYQQNVKEKTSFFVEWMALDLIRDAEGDVVGVTALEMETGDLHILEAKTVLLATGGAGRIFAASTNAFINTGDGLGMAARAGIPLQDMEFPAALSVGRLGRQDQGHFLKRTRRDGDAEVRPPGRGTCCQGRENCTTTRTRCQHPSGAIVGNWQLRRRCLPERARSQGHESSRAQEGRRSAWPRDRNQ